MFFGLLGGVYVFTWGQVEDVRHPGVRLGVTPAGQWVAESLALSCTGPVDTVVIVSGEDGHSMWPLSL